MGSYLYWWIGLPPPGITPPYANFINEWGFTEPIEQALRPHPQYGYMNQASYLQNVGQSSYDALTAKLEQRFHNGFNILASYTFSKTLTDADAIQPYYSTLQNQGGTQNPYDHKAEKAVSNEDIPNNFVVSYLYELSIGHGKQVLANAPKPVGAVISDWRVSGVQRYLGGQPISFFGANGIPGFDNGIRPNRVSGQAVKRQGTFNPFSFQNTGSVGADPSIAHEGDTYYVFATTSNEKEGQFPVRCSHDLHAWRLCGHVFETIPAWIHDASPTTRELWAPDISLFETPLQKSGRLLPPGSC